MDTSYIETLWMLLSMMQADLKTVRKVVKRPTQNKLMITTDHGKERFVAVNCKEGKRQRRYISEKDYIYKLANKAYAEELCKRLSQNEKQLRQALSAMLPTDYNNILTALPKHFNILDPRLVTDPHAVDTNGFPKPSRDEFPREVQLTLGDMDPWEWAALPYCENTDHLEFKTQMTSHGIPCRSKSEAVLFEIYDSLEIPFHYDEVVLIGGRQVSPDIIGARRDGTLIFHEHRGLFSDEYLARNDWKSGLYAAAGIIPGVNLIYTYDSPSGVINARLAREIIKDIYWL